MTIFQWPMLRGRKSTPLSREEKWLEIATIAVEHRERKLRHGIDRDALVKALAQAGASAANESAAVDAMVPILEAAEPSWFYWDGTERTP